jgi:hypothetical protein
MAMLADNPRLIAELHPTKNQDLGFDPKKLRARSNKLVWWICAEGPDHEWKTAVQNRTAGKGCPFCSGHRVSVTNALATTSPSIAQQWHPTKNGSLTARDVTGGSNKMVWWLCTKGPDHVWQTPVSRRTSGQGCPFCSAHRTSITNSLATRDPEMAAQWHPTKNGALTPADVTPGSDVRVWWQCPSDPTHAWQAIIGNRTRQRQGCAICAGKQVIYSRSLAAHAPDIAAQWHPTKNGALLPSQVTPRSGIRVWWRCPEGPDHEWENAIGSRLSSPRCPFCIGHRLSVTNALANQFPKLSREWHPTMNGALTPTDVTTVSNKLVWWQCPFGHAWQKMICARTRYESQCPECVPRKPRRATTRRARRYVHLASYEGQKT